MYVSAFRVPSPALKAPRFVEPDALFGALDGRHLVALGGHWEVEVYSVADWSGKRWIQVGLHGAQRYLVLLRLAVGDGPGSAVSALVSWLVNALSLKTFSYAGVR